MDVDTQDILGDIRLATQSGKQDHLFYLLVATPGGAPSSLHSKLVVPFLKYRGWQKVSYKNTGFRALYFLHDKEANNDEGTHTASYTCWRCRPVDENNNVFHQNKRPRKSMKAEQPVCIEKTTCSSCSCLSPIQRACKDRNDLKQSVVKFKEASHKAFDVHIILSQPVDYDEDFLEFASQPGAIED